MRLMIVQPFTGLLRVNGIPMLRALYLLIFMKMLELRFMQCDVALPHRPENLAGTDIYLPLYAAGIFLINGMQLALNQNAVDGLE